MKPSTLKCLQALRSSGGWTSGNALAEAVGWRYSARVYELRAEGYTIERRSSKRSAVDEYRLIEEPVQMAAGL